MSGRRIQPNPPGVQPISQIVDPTLAQPLQPMSHGNPVGSPAMVTGMGGPFGPMPGAAQQPHSQQDSAGLDLTPRPPAQQMPQMPPEMGGFQAGGEPFAKFHDDPPEGEEGVVPGEDITELSAEERARFAMLMYVGKTTKVIDVYSHPVVIESINVGDDLLIGMYRRDFQGDQLAEARAYQIAICACGIRLINGQPLYVPISMEESADEIFRIKVEKLKLYYPAVISKIYEGIRDLDREFAELADKMGKSRG